MPENLDKLVETIQTAVGDKYEVSQLEVNNVDYVITSEKEKAEEEEESEGKQSFKENLKTALSELAEEK